VNVRVVQRNDNHVLLLHQNVLVSIWHGEQDPAVCRHLYHVARDAAKRSGRGKTATLSIIGNGTPPPSAEAREALTRLHEDPEQIIYRSALVFARAGFVASIVRSVILGLRQRASRRGNHAVFSNVREALGWVTEGVASEDAARIDVDALFASIEREITERALVA